MKNLIHAALFPVLALACNDAGFQAESPLAVELPPLEERARNIRVVLYQNVSVDQPDEIVAARVQDYCGEQPDRSGADEWISAAEADLSVFNDAQYVTTSFTCDGDRMSGPRVYAFEADRCEYDNWVPVSAEFLPQSQPATPYHPFGDDILPVADAPAPRDLCEDNALLTAGVTLVRFGVDDIGPGGTFVVNPGIAE
jgi:hypothetical protein